MEQGSEISQCCNGAAEWNRERHYGRFSRELNIENHEKGSLNDILSNACRIEIARKNPVSRSAFFTNIFETFIEHMIELDMNSEMPKQKVGIESHGKGHLRIPPGQVLMELELQLMRIICLWYNIFSSHNFQPLHLSLHLQYLKK